mgnify:CR=1 FL=1
MATFPIWPASVTTLIGEDGFTEEPQRNVSSYQVDIGPPLEARMSSVPNDIIEGTIICKDEGEYEDLKDFYETDLMCGVLPCLRPHPRTQQPNQIFKIEAFRLSRVQVDRHDVAVRLRWLR